ncbi:MAG: glycosyl transferase family 1, partial [Dehalococcoidia bacterium]|nr:glycosyl transferase family 1 [Dehalococcoidia bacterium]
MKKIRLTNVDEYRPLVGKDVIKRLKEKARPLQRLHVVNINSTYYGGGVAQLLSSETLLMNDLGIKTGWRVIQGSPEFFTITKKMHNALQGADINLTDRKMHIYESVICENAVRNHLDHDVVIVHDPQPLPMIKYYK